MVIQGQSRVDMVWVAYSRPWAGLTMYELVGLCWLFKVWPGKTMSCVDFALENMLIVSSAAWNGLRETVECMLSSQTFRST